MSLRIPIAKPQLYCRPPLDVELADCSQPGKDNNIYWVIHFNY